MFIPTLGGRTLSRLAASAFAAAASMSLAAPVLAQTAPRPHTQPLAAVSALHMVSVSTGWAIGAQGVLRTADGGLLWHTVTPRGVRLAGNDCAYFLNAQTAWVATAPMTVSSHSTITVYSTHDAGRIWRRSVIPTGTDNELTTWSLSFSGARTGWLLGDSPGAAGSMGFTIWRSGDGGVHWHAVTSVRLSGGDKIGIAAASPYRVFLTSTNPVSGARPTVAQYDAAGRSVKFSLPLCQSIANAPVADPPIFFPGGYGLLPVHGTNTTGPGINSVVYYATHNGGVTWSCTHAAPGDTVSFLYRSYSFISPREGWSEANGRLYRTTDGGMTWRRQPSNLALSAWNVNLQFVSPKLGWAALTFSQNTCWLARTSDGGRLWRTLPARVLS